jgi:hypothetical protein
LLALATGLSTARCERYKVEGRAQQHHQRDDGGIDDLADSRGDSAGHQQNDGQRINEEEQNLNKARSAARGDEFVRADLVESQPRFCSTKTGPGVYLDISWPSHLFRNIARPRNRFNALPGEAVETVRQDIRQASCYLAKARR